MGIHSRFCRTQLNEGMPRRIQQRPGGSPCVIFKHPMLIHIMNKQNDLQKISQGSNDLSPLIHVCAMLAPLLQLN
jgi:hypothetical protein